MPGAAQRHGRIHGIHVNTLAKEVAFGRSAQAQGMAPIRMCDLRLLSMMAYGPI